MRSVSSFLRVAVGFPPERKAPAWRILINAELGLSVPRAGEGLRVIYLLGKILLHVIFSCRVVGGKYDPSN